MPNSRESILTKYYYETGFAMMLGSIPVFQNYYSRRPLYTGIQRHFAWAALGAVLGYYANQSLERKWTKRDAIIKHYIELHPEDFVENKKKYKEMFEEWYPIR